MSFSRTQARYRRQADHQPLDGATKPAAGGLCGLNEVGREDGGFGLLAHLAPPQEIDAAVMGDAEQPGVQGAAIVIAVELAIGFEQSLLHDVLAIQR
jgi:hypothetical protein